MTAEALQSNWALVAAAAVALVILAFLLVRLANTSASAKFRRLKKELADERGKLRRAEAVVRRAERRAERLRERAERVKPRVLQEANDAVADAKALARVANDKVLIAENHLRHLIVEEFPPVKQERLRARYLPESAPDKRPFSF